MSFTEADVGATLSFPTGDWTVEGFVGVEATSLVEELWNQRFPQVIWRGPLWFGPRPAPDQASYDHTPDACWRCDAVPAETGIGLCGDCRAALT